MKKIIPHLYVENCKEAVEYYKGIFGADVKNVQSSDGMEMFKGYEGKIIHAELHIPGDMLIYLADTFDNVKPGNNVCLVLDFESEEEINRTFDQLKAQGQVLMELQDTFWNARHGSLLDKYGITWQLNYSK